MYDYVKNLYVSGRLTDAGLINAIKLGWITDEEAEEIRKSK